MPWSIGGGLMFQLSVDSNSLITTISIVLIILTCINYVLSLITNRKQKRKLSELNDILLRLKKDLI